MTFEAYCLRAAALDGLGRLAAALADLSKAIVMDQYLGLRGSPAE